MFDRVCAICGRQEGVDDTLEKERFVHRRCVFFGKHAAVTVRVSMERRSELLRRDSRLRGAFDEMQRATNVRTFRMAMENLCRYLIEFKCKIEKTIKAYMEQRVIDVRTQRRLSIMAKAREKICETFDTLQVIAEEYLLERFDVAKLLASFLRG